MTKKAYQSLLEDLRDEVVSRSQGDGKMPTDAELCRRYGVSRQTARRAYQELVTEGLVRRFPGRGTVVAPRSRTTPYYRSFGTIEDLLALGVDTQMEVVNPLSTELDSEAAAMLGLEDDNTVMSLELVRFYDERPLSVSRICLRPEVGEQLEAMGGFPCHGTGTVLGRLDKVLPERVVRVEQEISAVGCPLHVAKLLDYEQGKPVLFISRIYTDMGGRNVEVSLTYYNPTVFKYRIQLGRE